MDPLTAIGLAGNIINFVDFSAKVVSKARHLYNSTTGATAENDEAESLARNLKDLAEKVQFRQGLSSSNQRERWNISRESVLERLSQQCIQIADELLQMLDLLKVKGDSKGLKSALQAVKVAWKQDHIDALQNRLDRISKQLTDGMNMEQLDEINRRLREMAVENTRLEANRSTEIDKLRQDFNMAVSDIKDSIGEGQKSASWLVLSDTARWGQAYFAEQVILQCLRFSTIDARQEAIVEKHSNTFSWIFDRGSSVKFVPWLEQADGVYWISGKPGSGKSTLMKFVADHETTKQHLSIWAEGKQLVVAKFFFWSASSHQSQKSQRGLLRTILYQILRQCPNLIQAAYHDQWIAMTSDRQVLKETRDELLTVPALLSTLRRLSTLTLPDTKFCFFLDGLDEYDGKPADIIELVNILDSFANVKTCISSRPWIEFEDQFGGRSDWKLHMQHLTREDIRLYVKDTLEKNVRFQQLLKEDSQCHNFVSNIVYTADGVFLWVFLVVGSLLEGLTNSDRIKDLQQRLDETPQDLKNYFKAMLFSSDNRYRTQTAQILSVAMNAHLELPLMAYWVMDQ